jgi:hypothetical protein
MAFSTSVRSCKSIHGYPQALRHFIETKTPRGKKWLDNERALYNQRSHHYRMVASETLIDNEPEWFDMVLYNTSMTRFFRPVNGVSQVYVRGYDSSASWKFLWYVCGYHPRKVLTTLEGNTVQMPFSLSIKGEYPADNGVVIPNDWSAVLRLREDKVDTSISAHRPVYKRVISDDHKAARSDFRKKIDTFLDVLMLRIPAFHAASEVSSRQAQPFSGVDFNRHTIADAVQNIYLDAHNDKDFETVISFAQTVYNKALSHRLDVDGVSLLYRNGSGVEHPQLDTKSFRASLSTALMKAARLDRKLGRIEIPQFPNELPREYTSFK